MKNLRPIKTKKNKTKEIESQCFMSNPFNFNNWLNHDGDGGTATKADFQIAQNNRIHSPDDGNPKSVTLVGATIVDVRTPQNAALACIFHKPSGQQNLICLLGFMITIKLAIELAKSIIRSGN